MKDKIIDFYISRKYEKDLYEKNRLPIFHIKWFVLFYEHIYKLILSFTINMNFKLSSCWYDMKLLIW